MPKNANMGLSGRGFTPGSRCGSVFNHSLSGTDVFLHFSKFLCYFINKWIQMQKERNKNNPNMCATYSLFAPF